MQVCSGMCQKPREAPMFVGKNGQATKVCLACRTRNTNYRNRTENKDRIKAMYGISPEEHQRLREQAGGICCLCLEAKYLVLDHDHSSKKVRAFICRGCNTTLGTAQDN